MTDYSYTENASTMQLLMLNGLRASLPPISERAMQREFLTCSLSQPPTMAAPLHCRGPLSIQAPSFGRTIGHDATRECSRLRGTKMC